MVEQNIYFQELYKKLDNLCKDCYNSQEGVSEYIRQMDKYMSAGERYVEYWNIEYSNLKHIRWIRNQLAHEVGTFNSDIVKDADILFVSSFHEKVLNAEDPLSILRKIYLEQMKNANSKINVNATQKPRDVNAIQEARMQPTKNEPSFLSKLLNIIKNFFK